MYSQQRIKPEAFASEHSYMIGAFYSRSNLYLFTRGPICILLLDLYSVIEIDHLAEQHQIIPLESTSTNIVAGSLLDD